MADEKKTETKPSMPAQPQTTQLPKVVVPEGSLNAILSEVRAMRAETTERLANIDTSIEVLHADKQQSNLRLAKIEVRLDTIEDRTTRHSGGLTRVSTNDAGQDAAIASIKATVDKLEANDVAQAAKVDSLVQSQSQQMVWMKGLFDRGVTFWSDPKVVIIRNIVYGAIVLWATQRGLVAK